MTITKSYSCNLCQRELKPDKCLTNSEYPEGWALTWTGPGNHRPDFGASLEPIRIWAKSPIHLCQVCVRAVQKFAAAACHAKELKPDTQPAVKEKVS